MENGDPGISSDGPGNRAEPIFNIPWVIAAIALVLIAIHVAREFISAETDEWLVLACAFIPARYDELAQELPGGEVARYTSTITHMLIHGDAMHLAFNTLWLLVFGGAVADRIGAARCLAFAIFTGLAGALAFYLWNPHLLAPVIGASGAISGLMGGTMRFMFSALSMGGMRHLREAPLSVPVMTLKETLADRRVQFMTVMLFVMNALAGIGFGIAQEGAIAWQAHLGGYAAGLLTFGYFAPTAISPREKQPIEF